MNCNRDIEAFAAGLIDGRRTEDNLAPLSDTERAMLIDLLIERSDGRRWLRASELLTRDLADRLLAYEEDFNQQRVDMTLATAIAKAGLDTLTVHAPAIAAGSGAPALWERLSSHPDQIEPAIQRIIESDDQAAIDATATHLLHDPANPYRLNHDLRRRIAIQILATDAEAGRGIAGEYLATTAPGDLVTQLENLARDRSTTVRGFAWLAAFRNDPQTAAGRAFELLGDESAAVEIRRSALNAAGEVLPTEELVELLSYFVVHPSEALALDAANLLHRHHRHPEIAIAAAGSPHAEVREIANRLMDPYRGSPAAGGSRPGDPLRTDPLLELMRRIEAEETDE